jgi:hypothetical protein
MQKRCAARPRGTSSHGFAAHGVANLTFAEKAAAKQPGTENTAAHRIVAGLDPSRAAVAGQPGPALASPVVNLTRQPILPAKMDTRVESARDGGIEHRSPSRHSGARGQREPGIQQQGQSLWLDSRPGRRPSRNDGSKSIRFVIYSRPR